MNRFSMIDYDLFTKFVSLGFRFTSHKQPDRVLTDLASMPPLFEDLETEIFTVTKEGIDYYTYH
jgi:hypothetical protein